MEITRDMILNLPKTDLHCHLDGSLRLATIIELAREYNIQLPSYEEDQLSRLLICGGKVDSLQAYLKAFDTTLLVLQAA